MKLPEDIYLKSGKLNLNYLDSTHHNQVSDNINFGEYETMDKKLNLISKTYDKIRRRKDNAPNLTEQQNEALYEMADELMADIQKSASKRPGKLRDNFNDLQKDFHEITDKLLVDFADIQKRMDQLIADFIALEKNNVDRNTHAVLKDSDTLYDIAKKLLTDFSIIQEYKYLSTEKLYLDFVGFQAKMDIALNNFKKLSKKASRKNINAFANDIAYISELHKDFRSLFNQLNNLDKIFSQNTDEFFNKFLDLQNTKVKFLDHLELIEEKEAHNDTFYEDFEFDFDGELDIDIYNKNVDNIYEDDYEYKFDTKKDALKSEDLGAEDLKTEEWGTKDLKAKNLKTKDLRAKNLRAKNLKAEDLGAEDLGAEDLGAKDLKTEDLRAKILKTEDLEAEDFEVEDLETDDFGKNHNRPYINSEIKNILEDMSQYIELTNNIKPKNTEKSTQEQNLINHMKNKVPQKIKNPDTKTPLPPKDQDHDNKTKVSPKDQDNKVPNASLSIRNKVTPDNSNLRDKITPDSSTLQDKITPDSSTLQDKVTPDSSTLQDKVTPDSSTLQDKVTPNSSTLLDKITTGASTIRNNINLKNMTKNRRKITQAEELTNMVANSKMENSENEPFILFGREILQNVVNDKGELLAVAGDLIHEELIIKADYEDCLIQLLLKTYPT
ncbi:hypothetical protein AN643_03820 [Candidatus Epulonipiscioides saccharophilum]|nr:hypothetical protein AN643_03820 [Epulopiscium sp. SCG-B10WGA-EpuloB]